MHVNPLMGCLSRTACGGCWPIPICRQRWSRPCLGFPSSNPMFGSYASYAGIERHEVRHGIDVWHPKYPVIPKIGGRRLPRG